jgi:hypothetical protein
MKKVGNMYASWINYDESDAPYMTVYSNLNRPNSPQDRVLDVIE